MSAVVTKDVARAARVLRNGGLVAFATETVYGLGADATDDQAVAGIFEAKGRPQFNPLIVHVADVEAALALGQFNAMALTLAHVFWPGAITLVVPRAPGCPVSMLVSAGLDSLAIRVPSHAGACGLLRLTGKPVAAPSANQSGRISPTRTAHVVDGLGERIDLVLDGGNCEVGLESTIVDCTGDAPVLLRPGGVSRERIEEVIGGKLVEDRRSTLTPIAPGQLRSHYAPRASVRLDALDPQAGEALLAFGADVPAHAGPVLNLSRHSDLREAAVNLFAYLHRLDAQGVAQIAVMPVPKKGLGLAINDRLQRAAAERCPVNDQLDRDT